MIIIYTFGINVLTNNYVCPELDRMGFINTLGE